MIYVDDLLDRGAPWNGGRSCHMTSDNSVAELLDFARGLRIPLTWVQPRSMPHFDLSPSLRARAVDAGALEVTAVEFVRAVQRLRERMAEDQESA